MVPQRLGHSHNRNSQIARNVLHVNCHEVNYTHSSDKEFIVNLQLDRAYKHPINNLVLALTALGPGRDSLSK
jgi:hypothetical protein